MLLIWFWLIVWALLLLRVVMWSLQETDRKFSTSPSLRLTFVLLGNLSGICHCGLRFVPLTIVSGRTIAEVSCDKGILRKAWTTPHAVRADFRICPSKLVKSTPWELTEGDCNRRRNRWTRNGNTFHASRNALSGCSTWLRISRKYSANTGEAEFNRFDWKELLSTKKQRAIW